MRKLFLLGMMAAAVALGVACSSSSSPETFCNGGCGCTNSCESDDDIAPQDGGSDATLDASCNYPDDAGNDPRCPAAYSTSYADTVCPQAGLTCGYPGHGDQTTGTPGCFEAAILMCEARDSGLGGPPDAAIFDDAGDADVGYWIFAQ